MYNKIKSFPDINPLHYASLKKFQDPILSSRSFYNYASGRSAIYHGMLHSNLPLGSEILLPAFHCGVEVEAVLRAGYTVSYYAVSRDLTIDFDDLRQRVSEKSKAIFIIHYFGFPQEVSRVQEFCLENDLLLLEDCAHSLYSTYAGQWLGTFGDYGFYSTQKMVALPNGGGLICNSESALPPARGKKYLGLALIKTAIKSSLEYYAAHDYRLSQLVLDKLQNADDDALGIDNSQDIVPEDYYDVPMYDYQCAISGLSMPLLAKDDYRQIIQKRTDHYRALRSMIENSPSLQIKKLIQGVCPLCLVVFAKNRNRLEYELKMRGIFPFIFGKTPHPSLPIKDFPDTHFLNDNVIGLPVHQQLKDGDLNRIAMVVNEIQEWI
jgi:perosamine synthetase